MNKLTKLLSVFVIAGAIGTGIAGAAGCKPKPAPTPGPSGSGSCNHQYGTTGVDQENGKHLLTCSICAEGTEGHTKEEPHKDNDGDDICDVCLADMEAVDPNAITNIVISFDNNSPKAGQTVNCTATCSPDTAADKSVTWSITSGDSLATIDATTGVLTIKADAKNGGEVTVKATSVATPTKSSSKPITLQKASKYDDLVLLETCKVDSADWANATSLTEITSATVGNGGIFMHGNNAAVSVTDGVATTNGGGLYVDFGETNEIIEGALSVKIVKTSSTGWGFTRIMNRTLENTDDYALSGRDNGKYRLKGTGDLGEAGTSVGSNVPSAWIEVYFKINKSSGMAVLKHGDTTVYNGPLAYTDVVGIGIFGKAVSADNQLEIKDVAICTYNLTLEEYKASYKEMIETVAAETDKLKGEGWTYAGDTDHLATGAALTKLLADFDTALTAATDRAAVNAAVNTASEAYLDAITNEYTAKVNAAYPATNYTGEENGAAYAAALEDLIADLSEAAMTPAEFTKILENYIKTDGVFDLILTNEESTKTTVVIEIYNGETKIGTLTTVNGATLKDGAKVTLDDIDDACKANLPSGKGVGKIFSDAEMTAAKRLTGDYTVNAENGETITVGEGADAEEASLIKLYVSYGDKVSTTISADIATGVELDGGKFKAAGSLDIATGIKGVFEAKKARINTKAQGGYSVAYETGGKSKASAQYVEINVTAACKISVVFASGKDSAAHSLAIFKGAATDPTKSDGLARKESADINTLATLTYRVAANETGKYYLCGTETILIYEITIVSEGDATSGETNPPDVGGEDIDNTGTFTFTMGGVKDDASNPLAPAYDTTGTEDISAESLLINNNTTAPDSNDFKFGANNSMTFKVNLKAGQTVTIKANGKTASSVKENSVVTSYTTATVDCTINGGAATTWSFEGTMGENGNTPTAPYTDSETVSYTATEDGEVEIVLTRKASTSKLKSITITVVDAAN